MLPPPADLINLQQWFAAALTSSVPEECEEHVCSTKAIQAKERLDIYHNQYWLRLILALEEEYPTLVRLFSKEEFATAIARPYLIQFPPNSWSLSHLGHALPQWIQKYYIGDDLPLIYEAALFDRAIQDAFFSAAPQPITELTLSQPLALNPSLTLLSLNYDWPPFRKKLLKEESDYWIEHPFPSLNKKQLYLVICREENEEIKYNPLSKAQFLALSLFANKNLTINELCQLIDEQATINQEASSEFHLWIEHWVKKAWVHSA